MSFLSYCTIKLACSLSHRLLTTTVLAKGLSLFVKIAQCIYLTVTCLNRKQSHLHFTY